MSNPLFDRFNSELKSFHNIETYVTDILEINWLFDKQMEILKKFYAVDENGRKIYNELILVAGMRGGKTLLCSIISTFEGYKMLTLGKPCKYYGLPAGQDIFILNIATSQTQARDTVFSQVKARIDNSKWWQSQTYKEHYNEFIFQAGDCRIIFRSEHSNSASIAGKTSKCVALDETARFVDTGGKSSGKMVYETVSRGTKTFGHDGILVSISSPIFDDDFQMQLYRQAIKKDLQGEYVNPTMLGLHYATWEMNDMITKEVLEPEFQKDPETAWRDFGARPSKSLEAYCREPDKVDAIVNNDMFNLGFLIDEILKGERDESEIAPYVNPGRVYFMAGDPAFKNDAFGFSMVHWEGTQLLYDIVWRFAPNFELDQREIDANYVKQFVLLLAKYFPNYAMVVDTWQFPETVQALKNAGVNVVQHFVDKETYDMFKEAIYMGTIMMPKYPTFLQEFKALELKRGKKVDHPRNGSKDVSDACANAFYISKEHSGGYDEPIYTSVEVF